MGRINSNTCLCASNCGGAGSSSSSIKSSSKSGNTSCICTSSSSTTQRRKSKNSNLLLRGFCCYCYFSCVSSGTNAVSSKVRPYEYHHHRRRHHHRKTSIMASFVNVNNLNCQQKKAPSKNGIILSSPLSFYSSSSSSPSHDIPIGGIWNVPKNTKLQAVSNQQHQQQSSLSATGIDTCTIDTNMTREMLQKCTVKQLREKIKELKDSNMISTDMKMSHLKLKGDIVAFLHDQYSTINQNRNSQNHNQNRPAAHNSNISSANNSNHNDHRSTYKAEADNEVHNDNNTDSSRINDNNNNSPSPRDMIFEHVMKRYPPIRELNTFAQTEKSAEESQNQEPSSSPSQEKLQQQQSQFRSILSYNPHIFKTYTGLGEMDVRQQHHPIMEQLTSSDLDIVTVGTASCVPGVTRGVSCTALRLQWKRRGQDQAQAQGQGPNGQGQKMGKGQAQGQNVYNSGPNTGGIWIFDCGESTQLQIQRTGSIRPGKISKIFITHAHGDHSFGLPGLLCIMGQDRDRDGPPVEIYGPEGLRMWLRTSIRYSVSRIVPPYRVHELMDIPMAPEWRQSRFRNGRYIHELDTRNVGGGNRRGPLAQQWGTQGLAGEDPVSWISRAPMMNLEPSPLFGEIQGGRDIYPIYNHPHCVDGAPIWEVEDEGDVKVHAAPMSHGVPCVGYVVNEESKPGRLQNDLVEPIVKRNLKALEEAGMRIPMKVMATIKDLPDGGSYTFPDGTTVYQKDVVEPPRLGRKVVICGDTADSRAIAGIAQGADVLVHEATNTFLSGIDKDTTKKEVMRDAQIHGHSTPTIAGAFAKQIGAKRLVLNHFSSRYKGDQSLESISIMTRIEQEAIKASGLPQDKVAAAWDFMVLPVPQN